MKDKIYPVKISVGQHENTVYIIEYTTSENARETAYEKIKRLIDNEPIIQKDTP